MILHTSHKPPVKTYLARVDPPGFLDIETGVIENDLATVLQPGSLLVFENLPDALETFALDLADKGTLEIYGDSLTAAYLRKGRRGVKFAGLQGYGLELKSFADLSRFWEFLTEVCGNAGTFPASTPGGTAMRLVGSLSPAAVNSPGKRIQEFAGAAYSAGARHSRPGRYPRAFLYDIHSAYPAAMRDPLPFGSYVQGRERDFFIARVIVDYDSAGPFSPLWVRDLDGHVFHPTKARGLELVLNSIDLETLGAHGRLKILKRLDVIGCELTAALAPVQEYLDKWQQTTPEYRGAVKIIRNAVYGKLAQRKEQFHFTLKPIARAAAAARSGDLYREYNGYQFGLFRRPVTVPAFNHLPVAGAITAKVRARVYGELDRYTIAVRTDSILSTRPRGDLQGGPLEGQWDNAGSGAAVVFGDSGFVLDGEAHMDGVQFFDPETMQAGSTSRDRFSFDGQQDLKQWTVAIEKAVQVKTRGSMIYPKPGEPCKINPAKIL